MMRLAVLYVFIFIASASFGQAINNSDNPLPAKQATDSGSHGEFYLSLDAKSEKLLIPPGNDSLKLFGIKIFSDDGKELLSRRIKDASKPTSIDISKLPDGDYIVHIVTTGQLIYKTKLVIRR